jgi:hypothetical protein
VTSHYRLATSSDRAMIPSRSNPMTTRLVRLPLGIAAGVALLLGLAACSDPEVATAETGDCIETLSAGSISELPTVDCDEPHDAQVIGVFDHEGDDFPGDAEIATTAGERCEEFFEEFVGAPFTETSLSPSSVNPTQQTWDEADDRETICLATLDDGSQLTESIEDNAESFPLGG